MSLYKIMKAFSLDLNELKNYLSCSFLTHLDLFSFPLFYVYLQPFVIINLQKLKELCRFFIHKSRNHIFESIN